jgi:hypothetical protein
MIWSQLCADALECVGCSDSVAQVRFAGPHTENFVTLIEPSNRIEPVEPIEPIEPVEPVEPVEQVPLLPPAGVAST